MRRRVPCAVVGLALLAGGCGGGTSAVGSASVLGPTEAAFTELPTYPGAEPAGDREEVGGVVSRSFRAGEATPRAVMDFYGKQLRRWKEVDEVTAIGPATFRGSWTRRGSTVVVVAGPAPAIVPGATDFRLSLAPVTEKT